MSNKVVHYNGKPYTEVKKKSGAIVLEPLYQDDNSDRPKLDCYTIDELMEEIIRRIENAK